MNYERGMKKFKKKSKNKSPSPNLSKEDHEIMKYVRFQTPRKTTVMQKQSVEYFVGHKAVDVLMSSKWATGAKNTEVLFPTREDACVFMNELLQNRIFYRALKNVTESKNAQENDGNEKEAQNEEEKKKDSEVSDNAETTTVRRRKVGKTSANEEASVDAKEKGSPAKKKKIKEVKSKVMKRYKLTVHTDQIFKDSKDIYIWLYNPVSPKTIVMGLGVLLCVIAATLFPLWPPEVRVGVYYLSVAGGIFIGSIFVIAFARSILYGVLWLLSGGKHHLWILPNILADVGFFDSFKPLYSYEYKHGEKKEEEKTSNEANEQEEKNVEEEEKNVQEEQEEEEEKKEESEEEIMSDKKEVKNPTESSVAESNTESVPEDAVNGD